MEIILDEEEIAMDAIPMVVKSPRIVDWKIYKEGKKSYYQIVRADGKFLTWRRQRPLKHEITSLKKRVKKLEKKQWLRTHKLKRLYKVSLTAMVDFSEDEQSLDDAKMFDVNELHGEEVFVEKEVANKEVNDEVQKVVEEVVKDTNTAKLIVDAAY
nr:hypothetical protein [Tanacetum cinerariifolium]